MHKSEILIAITMIHDKQCGMKKYVLVLPVNDSDQCNIEYVISLTGTLTPLTMPLQFSVPYSITSLAPFKH